jgi:hypothetical protein
VFTDVTLSDQRVGSDSYFLYWTGRYPINELSGPHIWALSNKSCNKLLVFAFAFTSSHVEARLPSGCQEPVDPAQLLDYVKRTSGPAMRDRFRERPGKGAQSDQGSDLSTCPVSSPNEPPRVESMVATNARLGGDICSARIRPGRMAGY